MLLLYVTHIVAGSIALLSGYTALYAAKGAGVHRRSGLIFVFSMVTMGILGAMMAGLHGIWVPINVPAGVMSAYLVVTALITVKPPANGAARIHILLMTIALAIGATVLTLGVRTVLGMPVASGIGSDTIPAFPFFLFGLTGLVGGIGDLRVLRSGPLRGSARIARHLWRMTFALLVAAMSFFFGQAQVIPPPIRKPIILATPVLAVLVTLIYWMWRVRRPGRGRLAMYVAPRANTIHDAAGA